MIVLAALLVGCSGGDGDKSATAAGTTVAGRLAEETPGDFTVRVNEYLAKGQSGRAWRELHPVQRKLITAGQLAECVAVDPATYGPEVEYRIAEVYDEPWQVPGSNEPAEPSKAVTVEVVVETALESGQSAGETVVETWTQHAFLVEDGWTWIVGPESIRDARAGTC